MRSAARPHTPRVLETSGARAELVDGGGRHLDVAGTQNLVLGERLRCRRLPLRRVVGYGGARGVAEIGRAAAGRGEVSRLAWWRGLGVVGPGAFGPLALATGMAPFRASSVVARAAPADFRTVCTASRIGGRTREDREAAEYKGDQNRYYQGRSPPTSGIASHRGRRAQAASQGSLAGREGPV